MDREEAYQSLKSILKVSGGHLGPEEKFKIQSVIDDLLFNTGKELVQLAKPAWFNGKKKMREGYALPVEELIKWFDANGIDIYDTE